MCVQGQPGAQGHLEPAKGCHQLTLMARLPCLALHLLPVVTGCLPSVFMCQAAWQWCFYLQCVPSFLCSR